MLSCRFPYIAAEEMEGRYGHTLFKDEKFFEGFYPEKVRIKKSRVIYKLLEKHVVSLHTDEIHQMFVDLDSMSIHVQRRTPRNNK